MAGSSNGRTPDFGSGSCRFDPCPASGRALVRGLHHPTCEELLPSSLLSSLQLRPFYGGRVAGTMREKNPGVWELRVYLGRDRRGRPIQKSRSVRGGKRQAKRALDRLSEIGR